MRIDARNHRERWTTIALCIALLTLLATLGACGGDSGTSCEPQPVETYAEPEPAYSPEPAWQLVTTTSGTGGSYPTVEAGSKALGEAADAKAESEPFGLAGGDVELRWTAEGEDGLMYLSVASRQPAPGAPAAAASVGRRAPFLRGRPQRPLRGGAGA